MRGRVIQSSLAMEPASPGVGLRKEHKPRQVFAWYPMDGLVEFVLSCWTWMLGWLPLLFAFFCSLSHSLGFKKQICPRPVRHRTGIREAEIEHEREEGLWHCCARVAATRTFPAKGTSRQDSLCFADPDALEQSTTAGEERCSSLSSSAKAFFHLLLPLYTTRRMTLERYSH